MKTFAKRLTGLVSASALALGLAAVATPSLAASITTSKHNLGTAGPGPNNVTTGTAEVCVFCHTPHASNTTVPAPLWNKKANTGTYTLYSSSTAQMNNTSAGTVGSISLACLSCHDGTQAMDNIINAPGSGGYDATGGGAVGLSYTWNTGAGVTVDADGKLTSGVAMLGTDLSNDHPVGMRYCGATAAVPSGTTTNCTESGWVAPYKVGSTWFIDTTTSTTVRNKADMTLYIGGPVTTEGQQVECATCHDVHNPDNGTFLRISNANSAVCTACHAK